MADLADVMSALKGAVLATLYPGGSGGSFPPSVLGFFVRVVSGPPDQATLKADMGAGYGAVSITPANDERNTTRYLQQWIAPQVAAPLTASIAGNSVTFAGSGAAGVTAGLIVDQARYVVPVTAGETPAGVAAALAALVSPDRAASAAGAVLTVPGARALGARIGVQAIARREIRRQERTFHLSAWASTVAARDQVAVLLDAALTSIAFLPLADGSAARLVYHDSAINDAADQALAFRRDLDYRAEWGTFELLPAATILFPALSISPAADVPGTPATQTLINQG